MFGFDHTIGIKEVETWAPKFNVFNLGLGPGDEGKLRKLSTFVKSLGHEGRQIHYLKVDVDGEELEVVPEWIAR